MEFKHLRGKHDQRDHGRRGIGQGSGGVSSAVASVTSLDSKETSSITEDARRAALDSFNSSIGDPRPDKDKGEYLDTIRSQLNTSTQEMRAQVKQRNALQRTIDRRVKKGGEPASQSERDQIRALDEGILSRATSSEFLREQYNARLGEFRQERQQALREQRRQERKTKQNNQQQPAAPNTPVKPASYLSEGIITSDVSPIDIDGLPSMDYVRVGTNNIQTINDATKFLDDGGDISGVPDDFLLEAMKGSSRFTQKNLQTAGINGAPRLFTDTRTGRRYISKYEQTSYIPNEDIAEVLGNNIAGRLGFPVGGMRFAGPATMARRNKNGKFNNISESPGRPVLLEHADNYTTNGVRRPSWNMESDPSQLVNAAILDYILLNPDRHADNYFVSGDQQRPRFVPIDASMGFQNARYRPKDIKPGEQPDLSGVEGIRAFSRSVRNGTVPSIRERVFNAPINQLTTIRQELRDEIARAQQRLRASEERTPFEVVARKAVLAAGSTDPGSTTRRPRETTVEFDQNGVNDSTNRFIQYPSRRINAFLNLTPDEILDAMLATS